MSTPFNFSANHRGFVQTSPSAQSNPKDQPGQTPADDAPAVKPGEGTGHRLGTWPSYAIPLDRPVTGRDLDEVRQTLGLSVADALWVFGNIMMNDWSRIVRGATDGSQKREDPLKNPTLALLVRLLDRYGSDIPVLPPAPSAAEVFALFGSVMDVNKRSMSILLGSEATAMYRWIELGRRQPPIVQRLMYFLQLMFPPMADISKRADFARDWRERVLEEGRARGVEDVFAAGSWVKETADRNSKKKSAPTTMGDETAVTEANAQPISSKSPVSGKDLDRLRENLQLSVADARWLFGALSSNDWSRIVHAKDGSRTREDPLKDPTLALLVRLLQRYGGELPVLPPAPSPEAMLELFSSAIPDAKRSLLILLGSDESTKNRLKSPIGQRLMHYLRLMFLRMPDPDKRKNFACDWRVIVLAEGKVRGIKDVFAAGSWGNETADEKLARSASSEATLQEPLAASEKIRAKAMTSRATLAGYVMYRPLKNGANLAPDQVSGALRYSPPEGGEPLLFELGSVALPLGVPVPKFPPIQEKTTPTYSGRTFLPLVGDTGSPSRLLMLFGRNEIRNEIHLQAQKAEKKGWSLKRVEFDAEIGKVCVGVAKRKERGNIEGNNIHGRRFLNIHDISSALKKGILRKFREFDEADKKAMAESGSPLLAHATRSDFWPHFPATDAEFEVIARRPYRALATRPDLWPRFLETDEEFDAIDVLVIPFFASPNDVRVRQVALVKHTVRYIETLTSQMMDCTAIQLPLGFGVPIPDLGNMRKVKTIPVPEVPVSQEEAVEAVPKLAPAE
jgi:hypothetical protein